MNFRHQRQDNNERPGLWQSVASVLLVAVAVVMNQSVIQATEDAPTPTFSADDLEFFEKHVRPLLATHCYECHGRGESKGGLRLTSREAMLVGGDTGPAIHSGAPETSLLIDAVNYGLYQMPPKSKLPDSKIQILEAWVRRGAPWPEDAPSRQVIEGEAFDLEQRKNSHWAWSPLANPPVPTVEDAFWPRDDLDYFILAKLERAALTPAERADPRALVRRAYFDLIGLPPEPEVVAAFAAHPTQEDFGRLIDRLLGSDHFGERWARHWLDLMRYAETRGHEFDYLIPNAWQYRDYVIRALNSDVPYDQFIREHIAGDLLPNPRRHSEKQFNESILATAFWYLNEWVHSPVDTRKDEADRFDNAIDVYSKAFLGLTVACARCHDHKFDAISQEDYYALVGFLQSSDYRQVRFETMEHNKAIADQLDRLRHDTGRKITEQLMALATRRTGSRSAVDPTTTVATHTATFPRPFVSDTHTLLADFDENDVDWQSDGPAFSHLPRGAIVPGSDATRPVAELVVHGRIALVPERASLHFAAEAERPLRQANKNVDPGKRFRLPAHRLTTGKLYYLLRGAAQIHAVVDSHRMIDGPLHLATFLEVDNDPHVRWIEQDLSRYAGHGVLIEISANGEWPLEVLKVVEGPNMPPLPPQLAELASTDRAVTSFDEATAIDTIQTLLAAPGTLSPSQSTRVVEAASHLAKTAHSPLADTLGNYHARRAELLSSLKRTSMVAPAIFDASAEDEALFIRGNPQVLGPTVSRRILAAFSTDQPHIESGSGRLQLAQRTVDTSLAPRVLVNRVWHHLLGRGIVPSVDNFGALGERPTHPDLLDHLAVRFVTDEWSIKRLIRAIMLSRTYQMSSNIRRQEQRADPANALYHRANYRRLEAEAIRDSLIALSGRLDAKLFGPSVPIHLTEFMDGRGRPEESGPRDGDGRRSIYLSVRRNFLSPMMLAFDRPQPSSPVGRRTVSNVPAQALMLLNDPFVKEQSSKWARRMLDLDTDDETRVVRIYDEAFGRPPNADEIETALSFIADHSDATPRAWADFCHVIINTKEFIFLR